MRKQRTPNKEQFFMIYFSILLMKLTMKQIRRENIDICPDEPFPSSAPYCPHGPTVLFERYNMDGKDKGEVERFYGCSCSRDRKYCSFFQRYGENVSNEVKITRIKHNKNLQPHFTHSQYLRRMRDFKSLEVQDRKLCVNCGLLLLKGEEKKHAAHKLKDAIENSMLRLPSKLLQPLENNKTNAQYLFSDKCTNFFIETFKRLGYKKTICLGTPRVHELIQEECDLSSMLLDIDHRFEQFYSPDVFQRYNMFNHHFFGGERAEHTFRRFLLEDSGPVAVLMDPPFGGLVSLLAQTLEKIEKLWLETNSVEKGVLPSFWIFPYFMEPRILDSLPGFKMLDYKVDYENHSSFQNEKSDKKKNKKGSPVRIFTNISEHEVLLPTEEGYRYCKKCEKHVAAENKHCNLCKACTSKDGSTYKHCEACGRCVKPSRVHCDTCKRCDLPQHQCDQKKPQGCHICGDLTHKRRECPKKFSTTKDSLKPKNIDLKRKMSGGLPSETPVTLDNIPVKAKYSKPQSRRKIKKLKLQE